MKANKPHYTIPFFEDCQAYLPNKNIKIDVCSVVKPLGEIVYIQREIPRLRP